MQEVDHYYAPAGARLVRQTLFRPAGDGDAKEIAEARELLGAELAHFERAIAGDYLAGTLSAADYALYPYIALSKRVEKKYPQHGISDLRSGRSTEGYRRREAQGAPDSRPGRLCLLLL